MSDNPAVESEKTEVQRLADWILANCPEQIGEGNPIGESAVDVAIRLMEWWLQERAEMKDVPRD